MRTSPSIAPHGPDHRRMSADEIEAIKRLDAEAALRELGLEPKRKLAADTQ
jgi:hypothetical protein